MTDWEVRIKISDSAVRRYWDQGTNDPATTASDVRDFVSDSFKDNYDLDAGEFEVVEAQEVEGEV